MIISLRPAPNVVLYREEVDGSAKPRTTSANGSSTAGAPSSATRTVPLYVAAVALGGTKMSIQNEEVRFGVSVSGKALRRSPTNASTSGIKASGQSPSAPSQSDTVVILM